MGWYDQETGEEVTSLNRVSRDYVLVAKYENRYNVTGQIKMDNADEELPDGTSVSPASQAIYSGRASEAIVFTIPAGYQIAEVTVNGSQYSGGSETKNTDGTITYTYPSIASVTSDTNVVVSLEKINYSLVRYDLNEENAAWTSLPTNVELTTSNNRLYIDEKGYTFGDIVVRPNTEPTRTGYQFTGWRNDDGYAFGNDGTLSYPYNDDNLGDDTLTFKAQWTPNTYIVRFNGNAQTCPE